MNRRTIARRFAIAIIVIAGACLAQTYDTFFVRAVDWLTYDARVKLRAALPEAGDFATNLSAIFYDDVAVQRVNDGGYSLYYAPATNVTSAQARYPRLRQFRKQHIEPNGRRALRLEFAYHLSMNKSGPWPQSRIQRLCARLVRCRRTS